jgi:transcriptional regulator with XRE-family HTH domain
MILSKKSSTKYSQGVFALKNQVMQDEKAILLDARKKLNLTQQQVADKAKITIRHYRMFESGERKLSTSSFITASKVLEALSLDLTAFARGDYASSIADEASIDANSLSGS